MNMQAYIVFLPVILKQNIQQFYNKTLVNNVFILCVSFILCIFSTSSAQSLAEYKIKAGYIYKFLYFANWPEQALKHSDTTIIIGILGKNPFGNEFKPIHGKYIENKKILVKQLSRKTKLSSIVSCHILFICESEINDLEEILKLFEDYPVLTVSDFEGFIDKGGMIGFINQKDKVKFEINENALNMVGIKIRSMMKRQAIRLIGG